MNDVIYDPMVAALCRDLEIEDSGKQELLQEIYHFVEVRRGPFVVTVTAGWRGVSPTVDLLFRNGEQISGFGASTTQAFFSAAMGAVSMHWQEAFQWEDTCKGDEK